MELRTKELINIVNKMNVRFNKYKKFLDILDSVIGDGDHGTNMRKGFCSIIEKIEKPDIETIHDVFTIMGNEMIETTGGTSGTLYGAAFLKIASKFKNKKEIKINDFQSILLISINIIRNESGSKIGDKTMLDTLIPAVEEVNYGIKNKLSIECILDNAINAARENAAYTVLIPAKRGITSDLLDKSIGYEDAGAISSLIMLEAVLDYYNEQKSLQKSLEMIFED